MQPKDVPYKVLNFLGAQINYGGRVTDDKDKLLISTFCLAEFGLMIPVACATCISLRSLHHQDIRQQRHPALRRHHHHHLILAGFTVCFLSVTTSPIGIVSHQHHQHHRPTPSRAYLDVDCALHDFNVAFMAGSWATYICPEAVNGMDQYKCRQLVMLRAMTEALWACKPRWVFITVFERLSYGLALSPADGN